MLLSFNASDARPARPEDAAEMARIYNQGIADRTATFETPPRTESDVRAWSDGLHPLLSACDEIHSSSHCLAEMACALHRYVLEIALTYRYKTWRRCG